jgi:transcriptional regulator with XRE-family HTH domain
MFSNLWKFVLIRDKKILKGGGIMNDNLKQIAARIKELRDINGVSIETLANEFKVSKEIYQKYEDGEADIPIGVLYEIANRFNMELTALISGEEPKLHLFSVVRKDNGLAIDRRKEYKYQDLAFNFKNKKAEVFLVKVDPDKDNKPPHYYSHSGQEFNFVIEGTLKVIISSHEVILNEGDSLYFDSGNQHGLMAMNGKPAKFLAFII